MSGDKPRYSITRAKGFTKKYNFKFLNAQGVWEQGDGFGDKEETKRLASLLATRAHEARQGLRTIHVDTPSPAPQELKPTDERPGVLNWAKSMLTVEQPTNPVAANAPKGRVTLVFTDIEGSTKLWEELKDEFVPMLELHNSVFRELIAKHSGYEVKTEGDAFMVAFGKARHAIRFSLEIQERLELSAWPGGHPPLKVRIGMHTGEPIVEKQPNGMIDYFGWVVNRAARVSGAGHGGQILISNETYKDAGDSITDALITDLGEHLLKGLEMPEIIRQLVPRRFPDRTFAAIKTVDLMLTNLNPSRMTFFGRENEVSILDALLRTDATPIMTITGIYGIGKTRLAHLWAGQHLDAFPAGTWETVFSTNDDFTTFCQRVGAILRCPEDQRNPSELAGYIATACDQRDGNMLLLLDQLDLEDPAIGDAITAWVRNVPKLRILVTRLRPLVIAGEGILSLDPLSLPDRHFSQPDGAEKVNEIHRSEAVQLFVERARFGNESFVLTPEEMGSAAMICHTLKGHPHAIEIAAARVTQWTPSIIFDSLVQHLADLNQGQDLDPLAGALMWSSRQLNETQQQVYAQCSLLPDEFTADEAAELVEVPHNASDAAPLKDILAELRTMAVLIRSPRERYDGAEVFSLPPASRQVADQWLDISQIRDAVNSRLRSKKLRETRKQVFKTSKKHRSS